MSSIFPSRTSTDLEPSRASQVPFLTSNKPSKSAPSIIKKIARAGSARNSIDLQSARASSEQAFPHYSADSGFSDGTEWGEGSGGKRRSLKLNRSGSSTSAFSNQVGRSGSASSQPSEIEIPSQSATRLNGLGRGSSYHARSTSGTSGISSWSSAPGNSGGITPVGGTFRHPWAQTPTIKRENSWLANGLPVGGHASSYSQPSIPGFGYSDEDLRESDRRQEERERERDFEIRGRRSLQLGGGYGLNLDGVDEGLERYERPTFVRSSTSITQRSGNAGVYGNGNGGFGSRASYTQGDTSLSYTPISALPPPLAGSSRGVGRGLNLRVNTAVSGVSIAGLAGQAAPNSAGAAYGVNATGYDRSGQVTPINGSSSRVSFHGRNGSTGSLNGAGVDSNSAPNPAIAPRDFNTSTASSSRQNLNPSSTNLNTQNPNSTNNNSISTNNTLYDTAGNSNLNLNNSRDSLAGNNLTSHLQSFPGATTSQPQLTTSQQDSTASPTQPQLPRPSSVAAATLPRKSTAGTRSRPSLDMRTRGLSEPIKQLVEHTKSIGVIAGGKSAKKEHPADVHEARHIFNENQRVKAEKLEKEQARKEEKAERRRERGRERGRASTTSIGSFQIPGSLGGLVGGRGRSGTGATAETQETYSTAMGSTTTGSRRHTRGNSGATQAGVVADGLGGQTGYGYDATHDVDDRNNTQAPAFLDTGGEYAPTEADLADIQPRPRSRSGTRGTYGTNASRQKSPKSDKFKEKLHGAKSDTKSQWAAFMLFLKTKLLKVQRKAKKLAAKATGGKKKNE